MDRRSTSSRGRHVVFLSWRDTRNPEGGGAERYLEKMARGTGRARRAGSRSSAPPTPRRPPDEVVDGVRFVRRGSKLTRLPPRACGRSRRGGSGDVDVVVDVQNGLPFFTRAGHPHAGRRARPPRAPRAVAGRLPRAHGRVGWWIERRLAPRLYRALPVRRGVAGHPRRAGRRSASTRRPDRRRAQRHRPGRAGTGVGKAPHPDDRGGRPAGAAQAGRARHRRRARAARASYPDLRLHVVGSGWWEAELPRVRRASAAPATRVVFEGHVDEERKHEIYEQSWVLALPSLKEGWGLVGRRGRHAPAPRRSPTASAGGTRESIADGRVRAAGRRPRRVRRRARADAADRRRAARDGSAAGALDMSHRFTWGHAQESFAHVVARCAARRRVDSAGPRRGVNGASPVGRRQLGVVP